MLGNLFGGLPPVTQVQLIIIAAGGMLSYSEIFSRYDLYFSFEKIFFEGQVWRLLTSLACFKFNGVLGMFQLYFMVYICSQIERSSFKRGSIDYLYFQIVLCLAIYIVASALTINFLSNIYFDTMLYYFGRLNANQVVLINLIPVRAPYILWLFVLIEWLTGNPDLKSCIISIVLGHTLYFVYNIFPKLRFVEDKEFFDTPAIFIRSVTPLFSEEHIQRQDNINELALDDQ